MNRTPSISTLSLLLGLSGMLFIPFGEAGAQNQGSYLFLDLSSPEADSELAELNRIRVETRELPDAGPTASGATDSASPMRPASTAPGSFSPVQAPGTRGTFGDSDAFGGMPTPAFSAPANTFQQSAFGEPEDNDAPPGSTFFNEEAFTNPSFGED